MAARSSKRGSVGKSSRGTAARPDKMVDFLVGLATDPARLGRFILAPDAELDSAGIDEQDRAILKSGNPFAIHARIGGAPAAAPSQVTILLVSMTGEEAQGAARPSVAAVAPPPTMAMLGAAPGPATPQQQQFPFAPYPGMMPFPAMMPFPGMPFPGMPFPGTMPLPPWAAPGGAPDPGPDAPPVPPTPSPPSMPPTAEGVPMGPPGTMGPMMPMWPMWPMQMMPMGPMGPMGPMMGPMGPMGPMMGPMGPMMGPMGPMMPMQMMPMGPMQMMPMNPMAPMPPGGATG